jgi:hypothetical protein
MAATNRNEGMFMFHIHLKTAQPIGIKASLEVGALSLSEFAWEVLSEAGIELAAL